MIDIPVKVTECPECGHEDTREVYEEQMNEVYWCPECGNRFNPEYKELKEWVNEHNGS